MSDNNDLIRRGDAIAAMNSVALTYGATWEPHSVKMCKDAVRTLPAVQVTGKPGEIERAVWSAMSWAADYDSGSNGAPEYTDCGNSFAETECRRAAARIRSALTVTPAHDAAKVAALVEAVEDAFSCGMVPKSSAAEGGANKYSEQVRVADKLRAAIAAMKEG